MSNRLYLAGPITGLTYYGCTNWRTHVAKQLEKTGIECFSPMRALEFLRAGGTLGGSDPTKPLVTSKAITSRDRFDVERCDAVLMNLLGAEAVSVGTMIEAGWADAYRKPVILAIEPRRGIIFKTRNVHDHPMLSEIASFVVPSLSEAIEIVRCTLLPR